MKQKDRYEIRIKDLLQTNSIIEKILFKLILKNEMLKVQIEKQHDPLEQSIDN